MDRWKTMRRYWIMMLIGVFGLLTAAMPLAAQEDEMVLAGLDATWQTRPPVVFPHARHTERLDCTRCHHDYDAYGNNAGGEGQACADCHTAAAVASPVPLMRAYHLQCRGCHRKALMADQGTPPVMCGQCHRRGDTTH